MVSQKKLSYHILVAHDNTLSMTWCYYVLKKAKKKTQPCNKKAPVCEYFPSKVTFAATHIFREPQDAAQRLLPQSATGPALRLPCEVNRSYT